MTSTKEGKVGAPDPAAAEQAETERRAFADRRRRPTPMFSRFVLWGGRRSRVRRDEEREGAFVDRHGPLVLFVVLAIVALNLLDAYFTLLFLSHGGTELNPFVQAVLDSTWHPWPFVLLKTVGIGIACAFLMMAKYFRPARWGMAFVFVGYTVLLGWHLFLLQFLPS
ncbi:MAG: hypothetical protein KAI24_11455 [Planctomycetes bacterium]|nr:hypothetical protein [Planctomycetota bacterium]